jgi:lipopolysaccharide assembly protein A
MTTEPQPGRVPTAATDPSAPGAKAAHAMPRHRHTRISGLWIAVACFAVVLLLLLIFILQNGRTVDIAYLGAHGHLPLGVAMLLAAVCGGLLVALAGAVRISQLRAVNRRHRRTNEQLVAAVQSQRPADPGR